MAIVRDCEINLLSILLTTDDENIKDIAYQYLKPEYFKNEELKNIYTLLNNKRYKNWQEFLFQNEERINKNTILSLVKNYFTDTQFPIYLTQILEDYILTNPNKIRDIDKIKEQISILDELTINLDNGSSENYQLNNILKNYINDYGKNGNYISTQYEDLDKLINGWQLTNLVIIAARPGIGKTSFALNLINRLEIPILMFSLEMSNNELCQRLIALNSNINLNDIKKERLDKEQKNSVSICIDSLSKKQIFIDDTPKQTIITIENKIKYLVDKFNIKVVIVDYLQLISSKGNGLRQVEISIISRNLKIIAKKYNIVIICISQLSRACETRENKRPILSDLRDSGSIEQDADIVMFLYDDNYYKEERTNNIVELIIAKNRNGVVGKVQLEFIKERNQFLEYQQFEIGEY